MPSILGTLASISKMGTDGSITIFRQNSKIICRNFKNFKKGTLFSYLPCFRSIIFTLHIYIEGTYAKYVELWGGGLSCISV